MDRPEDKVLYCGKCLSLAVKSFQNQDFCSQCGSTDILAVTIGEWEELYRIRYKKDFINHTKKRKE